MVCYIGYPEFSKRELLGWGQPNFLCGYFASNCVLQLVKCSFEMEMDVFRTDASVMKNSRSGPHTAEGPTSGPEQWPVWQGLPVQEGRALPSSASRLAPTITYLCRVSGPWRDASQGGYPGPPRPFPYSSLQPCTKSECAVAKKNVTVISVRAGRSQGRTEHPCPHLCYGWKLSSSAGLTLNSGKQQTEIRVAAVYGSAWQVCS